MSAQPPADPEYVTCDIYGRQPGTKEYKLVEHDKSFVEYIKGRGFKIIPIKEEDELHYANNFLAIAPRHIMAVGGQSEELQTRFREAGVTVEWIPLESLIDGYGAAHCMTQVLERQTATPTNAIALKAVQSQTEEAYTLGGVKDAKSGVAVYKGGKRLARVREIGSSTR